MACLGKKVLVVDDAPLMRMVIMNMLKDDPNLDVVGKAKNGAEALKLLPSRIKPDLILLDIEMPLMDGLTFLRHARSTFGGKILGVSRQSQGSALRRQWKPPSLGQMESSPSRPVTCHWILSQSGAANWFP